ncbi:MAG: hypothetical protein JW876_07285 [Candidatus Krumholzibacteriota bacterium]|nr:hypothetical protein [Candidatus Krumholzibacteriota bacterium]
MATILAPYNLCQVIVHVKQEFSIRLQKPLDSKVEKSKDAFRFQEADLDKDGDFVAKAGHLRDRPDVKVRATTLYSSQNRLSIDLLGGETKDAIAVLISLLETLYGLKESDLFSGIEYVEYKTVTRVQLSTTLDGVFSDQMQEILRSWRRFDSKAIVSPLSGTLAKGTHGIISITDDYYERLYKGQEDIFVVPSELVFHVFIPTKYYKMTNHKVRINVQSFEDYSDRIFFFSTELPYEDHVALIDAVENMG